MKGIEIHAKVAKFLYKMLTVCGAIVLLLSLWILYPIVDNGHILYSKSTLFRRDNFKLFTLSSSLLGIISVISTFFLSSVFVVSRFSTFIDKIGQKAYWIFSFLIRIVILILTIIIFVIPFIIKRKEIYSSIHINDVCGANANFTFEVYKRGSYETNENENIVWRCKNQDVINPLGCVGQNSILFEDQQPASKLPNGLENKDLILLKPSKELKKLKSLVTAICSK